VGELIAKLYFWQQAMGPGFAAIAIREGKAALRATLTPDALRRDDVDWVMDEVLASPLAVLAWVAESESERARAH
jgi:hypothetical protein